MSNFENLEDDEDGKSGARIFLDAFLAFWKGVFRFPIVLWSEFRGAIRAPIRCENCSATKRSPDEVCAICGRTGSQSSSQSESERKGHGKPFVLLVLGDQVSRIAYLANSVLLVAWFLIATAAFFWGLNWPTINEGGVSGAFSLLISVLLGPLNLIVAAAPSLYLLYRKSKLEQEPKVFGVWAVVSSVYLLNFPIFAEGLTRILALATVGVFVALFVSHVFRVLSYGIGRSWFDFFTRSFLDEEPFGRPGSHLDKAPFEASATQSGQLGEQMTAFALKERLHGKAVLFNSLNSPNPESDGDIDHAVLFGNSCVLLDSKYWEGATYEVEMGNIFKDGQPFKGGSTNLVDRVSEFRQLLPEHVECIGFVVLANKSAKVGKNTLLGPGAGLIEIDKLLEDIEVDASNCEESPDYEALKFLMSLSSSDSYPRKSSIIPLDERDWSLLIFVGKMPQWVRNRLVR